MSNLVIQKRNLSHKPFFEDQSRWVVSYGGAGSAKSYSTAQKISDRIITEPNHRYLIVRKVARTLRVSVFQLFRDIISTLEEYENFKINKSDMTITYLPNNSQLLFFGLDDIEKLKSIQGISSIWIEEASECEQGDILELNRRLRGETTSYKQIILTFNPISHLHWLKLHFFDNPNTKASIYKTTYLDNKFIDEEYKQEIENIKEYDEQQYRIYALGEWGILSGHIIHNKFDKDKHISNKTVRDFRLLHVGVDFNVGGCCLAFFGEDEDGYIHCVKDESLYDTEEIISHLQLHYKNKDLILYPDASGSNRSTRSRVSDVKMLKNAGFKCKVPESNGSTAGRYNAVNRKLMSDTLLVNPKTAKATYEALQLHTYNAKGEPEKFNVHPAVDDRTDAFDYCIARMFPINNKTTITQSTHI